MLAACRLLARGIAGALSHNGASGIPLSALSTSSLSLNRWWSTETGVQGTDSPAASVPSFSGRSSEQDVREDLVDQYLGVAMLSRHERLREQRRDVIAEFQRHRGDVGSPEVMVAIWTHQIRERAWHFIHNRKNLHPMRHLEMLVHQRRRYLTWMRRERFDAYCYVLHKLGLRDIYTETPADARYLFGSRHGDPVDDRLRRQRFKHWRGYKVKKARLWVKLGPRLALEDPSITLEKGGPDPGSSARGPAAAAAAAASTAAAAAADGAKVVISRPARTRRAAR